MKTRWLTRAADLAVVLVSIAQMLGVEYQHAHADDEGNTAPSCHGPDNRLARQGCGAGCPGGEVHSGRGRGDQAGTPEAEGERVFGRVFWDAREGAQQFRLPYRGLLRCCT